MIIPVTTATQERIYSDLSLSNTLLLQARGIKGPANMYFNSTIPLAIEEDAIMLLLV